MKKKILGIALVILVLTGFFGWRHYTSAYPYGRSHCCIKVLTMSLIMYAENHSGLFPTGKETAEKSLALLANTNYGINAEILRGKTVPVETTQRALDHGAFGPDSTGWHYIEGLTTSDDTELAIIWDKVGLDHNGRNVNGGREVGFVDGSTRFVSGKGWAAFVANQQNLLNARDAFAKNGISRLLAKIQLPDGTILDEWEGAYELEKKTTSGSGKETGSNHDLKFNNLLQNDGDVQLILRLTEKKLQSKPVTIQILNRQPSVREILFEMEEY